MGETAVRLDNGSSPVAPLAVLLPEPAFALARPRALAVAQALEDVAPVPVEANEWLRTCDVDRGARTVAAIANIGPKRAACAATHTAEARTPRVRNNASAAITKVQHTHESTDVIGVYCIKNIRA